VALAAERLPALFVGGAVALDFLNSIARPVDTVVDWIEDGEGLLAWLHQSALVPEADLEALRARTTPCDLDKLARQARELREWFRRYVRTYMGRPLTSQSVDELGPVNRLLEGDRAYFQVVARADRQQPLELRKIRLWHSAQSLLAPIAEAIAEFVCDEDFTDVKACEGAACTLLFVDRTQRRERRWCSMAVCGNRAKQTRHRSRQREL
jgi:predicted RNA-binding Zn ribbon-like protein